MMKKNNLLILAVAALGFAACANDETTAVNEKLAESNAISFRANVGGNMRTPNGNGVKTTPWENGDKLYVYATYKTAKYFQDQFDYDGSTGFFSTTKYYWPSDVSSNHVTFDAFWGAAQSTSNGKELASAYTVDTDVDNSKDLLYANEEIDDKPADGGVALNLRHMLSQVIVKVANDQANLKITVGGFRIGYIAKTGTFLYTGGKTTINETGSKTATLIKRTDWTVTSAAADNKFDQEAVDMATLTSTAAATVLGKAWIMMPQDLRAATAYSSPETKGSVSGDPTLNGAYIAVKMKIESLDNAADKNVVGTVVAEQWCYWPIGTEWKPGYVYTYTVNVGSGGYQPRDQDNDSQLDPVLDGAFIWFTPSCSVDAWVAEERYIGDVTYTAGATYTYNVANGTTGVQSFKVTGLTPGSTVAVESATNNNKLSGITVSPTTVPANGTVTVSGTLADNEGTVQTSTITLNETGAGTSTTIINIVQEGS